MIAADSDILPILPICVLFNLQYIFFLLSSYNNVNISQISRDNLTTRTLHDCTTMKQDAAKVASRVSSQG